MFTRLSVDVDQAVYCRAERNLWVFAAIFLQLMVTGGLRSGSVSDEINGQSAASQWLCLNKTVWQGLLIYILNM